MLLQDFVAMLNGTKLALDNNASSALTVFMPDCHYHDINPHTCASFILAAQTLVKCKILYGQNYNRLSLAIYGYDYDL